MSKIKDRGLIIGLFALGIIALLCHLYAPYAYKLVIDEAIQSQSKHMLLLFVLLFGIASILGEFLKIIKQLFSTYLETQISLKYRKRIHEKVRNLSDFNNLNEGEMLSYNINDVNQVKKSLRLKIDNLIYMIQVFSVILIVGFINWKYIIIIILMLPVYVFFPKLFGRKITKEALTVQKRLENISSCLSNSYKMSQEIRIYNREDSDSKSVHKEFTSIVKPVVLLELFQGLYTIGNIFYFLFVCLFLYLGGLSVINREISLGTLIALLTYMGYISTPVQSLVSNFSTLKSIKASKLRIQKFYNRNEITFGKEILCSTKIINIKFNNVSMIKQNKTILNNINFNIGEGEFIGIIGESGSGKTSLLNLIARLENPSQGFISIQDRKLSNIDKNNYYDNLKYVFQYNSFIEGSLMENLLINEDENFEKDYLNSLFHSFGLDFLVNNYQYEIKSNGNNLSGGQKQRIAIIRALIRKPKILLLDEISSSLDTETEFKVLTTIKQQREGLTTIFVTHKHSNLIGVDKILKISNGSLEGVYTSEILKGELETMS